LVYQLFYFAEAGILAQRMNRHNIPHLHNHFANSSCTVAMLASQMGGFTYSFTIHGPAIFFEPRYWRIDEKIRRALFVSCISHYCRSQTMIFAPMERWDRLHIVHCGVDPEYYQTVNHQGEGHRLLFVGRIAVVKGLPMLLQAMVGIRARRPTVHLTVVGDGPDRSRLEALAEELRLKKSVSFTGYQTQAQVRAHLSKSDVFVLPSFAEGIPVVLMEAMAAGVPVVATRIAGVEELVEDKISGFIVPPGDPNTLKERIDALLADGTLRNRFGESGRKKVKRHFDIRKEAAWLHQIMAEALQGRIATARVDSVDDFDIPVANFTSY
jgi:colanic acid/amylovoran biosynthesis glycosyltransferase